MENPRDSLGELATLTHWLLVFSVVVFLTAVALGVLAGYIRGLLPLWDFGAAQPRGGVRFDGIYALARPRSRRRRYYDYDYGVEEMGMPYRSA